MDTFIIGSMCQSTGKTSLIAGLARVLGKRIGYAKPFGDRMVYRKKRLWDYDSALIMNLAGLSEQPGNMSLGFDHAKLRFMYDEPALRERIQGLVAEVGADKDILFIEGGKDINYGSSVLLDPISLAGYTDGRLIIVASGDENAILDDLAFLKRHIDFKGVRLEGIVLNKIANLDDFKDHYLPIAKEYGFKILGMIPYRKELMSFTAAFLSERLFAKVVTGEDQLHRAVKGVFVGTMHVHEAMQSPFFKEEGKLVVTSGNHTEMILAAIESNAACIVLTDNIFPPAKIIEAAKEKDIPLLVVPADTFQTARQLDLMEPLLTKDDHDKIALLETLVRDHVNTEELLAD
jgi:uncharacterized protein